MHNTMNFDRDEVVAWVRARSKLDPDRYEYKSRTNCPIAQFLKYKGCTAVDVGGWGRYTAMLSGCVVRGFAPEWFWVNASEHSYGDIPNVLTFSSLADRIEKKVLEKKTKEDTISFPRWWIERVVECLKGDPPRGKIGDNIFLIRNILEDKLNETNTFNDEGFQIGRRIMTDDGSIGTIVDVDAQVREMSVKFPSKSGFRIYSFNEVILFD